MTLDDFFTLTEMKDGLTSVERVEELVSMMKKDSNIPVKNVAEAARQWSTVASTLIVTVNQDCLDQFVSSDVLYFLNWWIQEAEKCCNDVADCSVEESVSVLLEALKKLPIDQEKLVSSGIAVTIKKLFGHKSSRIQERASGLFDDWNHRRGADTENKNSLEDSSCHDNGFKQDDGAVTVNSGYQKHSSLDIVPGDVSPNADQSFQKPTETEQRSGGSDGATTESVKDVASIASINDHFHPTLSKVDKEEENSQGSPFMSNPSRGSSSTIDESLVFSAERITSIDIGSSSIAVEEQFSNITNLRDFSEGVMDTLTRKDMSGEIGDVGLCPVSMSSVPAPAPVPASSTDPATVEQPMIQSDELSNVDTQDPEHSPQKTLSACLDGGTDTLVTDGKSAEDGPEAEKDLRTTGEADGCCSENSSIDECLLRKPEHLETSLAKEEDTEAVDNLKELSNDTNLRMEGGEACTTTGKDTTSVVDMKVSETNKTCQVSEINNTSDMDLEYGVEDALEVARQVAKEVEREVVDYREQFCSSSSEKDPEGGLGQPSSPNSINSEKDQPVMGPQYKTPIGGDLFDGSVFPIEEQLISTDNLDKPEDYMHGTGSSQVTEALQLPAGTTKMNQCDFDLNEVCSEEMDRPRMSGSVPTIVAAMLPDQGRRTSPPRFQGERGWKGSAATSAFRPASGLKAPDIERTLSVEESSQSIRQRPMLDFDLNIEGYGDAVDAVVNPAGTLIPVSIGLPSGESSVEVCSRRAERLKLDLNRVLDSDDGGPSSDARMEGQTTHLFHNSPSPASSSSSRHPPLRNFDLNGNPSLFDDFQSQMNGSLGFRADDSVISILGSKVQVKGKEPVSQIPSFLQNGRGVEITNSPVMRSDGRAVETTHSPVIIRSDGGLRLQAPTAFMPPPASAYGYNLAAAPSMPLSSSMYGHGSVNGIVDSRGAATPSMSLSSSIYGPVLLNGIVDSRGTPMAPHLMGMPDGALPAYPASYLMNMTGPMMGLNGSGPARPSFDLNSGSAIESDNRGSGSSRHAFFPGQAMSMDEQMRSVASQAQGLKRKEADGGWDVFPANCRRQPPWG